MSGKDLMLYNVQASLTRDGAGEGGVGKVRTIATACKSYSMQLCATVFYSDLGSIRKHAIAN